MLLRAGRLGSVSARAQDREKRTGDDIVTWIRNRPLGLVYRDKTKSFAGYTLFSPVRGHHADLLDADGRIVHQWHHPDGVQHVKWLPNGHLLVHTLPPESPRAPSTSAGAGGTLLELDHDSNVVWQYRRRLHASRLSALDERQHARSFAGTSCPTEIAARVQGGHIAARRSRTGCGVTSSARSIPPGTTVREWRSWEHLSPDHHVKCPLESRKEWTHLNSIELTPDGDWLLSFRLTSTIAIVDGATGDVRWRWGVGSRSRINTTRRGSTTVTSSCSTTAATVARCRRSRRSSRSTASTAKIVWSYQAPIRSSRSSAS